MSNQLDYLKTKNLGFNKDQILVIPYRGTKSQQVLDNYRAALTKYGSIINVSGSYTFPSGYYDTAQATSGNTSLSINHTKVDYDYVKTLGITLKEGRDFSRNIASDTTGAIIVNEAVVDRMDWKSALGKKIVIEWMGWEVKVIGVIKNFHYASLHEKIEALVFYLDPFVPLQNFFVKINSADIYQTLDLLRDKWKQVVPDYPFEYFFLDQRFAQHYHSEERWSTIIKYASIVSIFIACFGLFGLSALVMSKRTKEIGIRKVVGASIMDIFLLLSKEFMKWIILANIIAWPCAYLSMNYWLQNFAYKIDVAPWIYLLATIVAAVIALATISTQAFKAAIKNPVETLQYE